MTMIQYDKATLIVGGVARLVRIAAVDHTPAPRTLGDVTLECELEVEQTEAERRILWRWLSDVAQRRSVLTPARFVTFVTGGWWWKGQGR